MKTCMLLVLLTVILGGCAGNPAWYAEIGLGYRPESGDYGNIDETGCIGIMGIGVELDHGIDIGAHHKSQCFKRPEIAYWDLDITKRWGGRRK